MTQQNNNYDIADNNIYMLRFRLLLEYYKKLFYSMDDNIIDTIVKEYNITNRSFLISNLNYLMVSGYLDRTDETDNPIYGITFRGIHFVESITDGYLGYTDEKMKGDIGNIRRRFREQDSIGP